MKTNPLISLIITSWNLKEITRLWGQLWCSSCHYPWRIHVWYIYIIYANIKGFLLMGSMLPHIPYMIYMDPSWVRIMTRTTALGSWWSHTNHWNLRGLTFGQESLQGSVPQADIEKVLMKLEVFCCQFRWQFPGWWKSWNTWNQKQSPHFFGISMRFFQWWFQTGTSTATCVFVFTS